MADAVVIGAGPNGLVAANMLADRGWEVVVLEATDEPGGAVRSAQLVEPGYTNDVFSAFYPFAVASPHIRALELESHGLRWLQSEYAVAHPGVDGSCPAISPDLEKTAASLDEIAAGDGDAWRALYALWQRIGDQAIGSLFGQFPPVVPALSLVRRLRPGDLMRFVRFALLPVRRMGEEWFRDEAGARLLAGNALHADVSPEAPPSGVYGWVLCCLAQQHGFPVPAGGAGMLTAALVRRLGSRGGQILCGRRADAIETRGRRAVAVQAAGERYPATRAIIADVSAPMLYRRLVPDGSLPARLGRDLERFQWDNATVKVDWTLDGPIPWSSPRARTTGTIHVARGLNGLTRHSADMACRMLPRQPYLVVGQYAHVDPDRQPPGKETAWAYTHVPQRIEGDSAGELRGTWDDEETARFADRMEEQVERLAPGFRSLIRGRHVLTPNSMQAENPNLVNGALNGGTAQIYQQLLWRPVPSLARPETPVDGLFLGSASAHPGGGVHGGPGANAARAAIAAARPWSLRPVSRMSQALQR